MSQSLGEHPLAERFRALGPEQVVAVVEGAGFTSTGRQLPLNSYENRVYRVDLDDGGAIIAKFYRPGRWSLDAIDDEHDFLDELDDAGVPVACPIELSGEFTIGTTDGREGGINYALYEHVAGRMKDEPNLVELKELGRHIGLIHRVGASGSSAHRQTVSVEHWGRPFVQAVLGSPLLPQALRQSYALVAETLLTAIDLNLRDAESIRIHGDCHHGNVLWDGDGPVFIDFDDFAYGPPVQDLWLMSPGNDVHAQVRLNALLAGYREVREFDDDTLKLIEPLRSLRLLRYTGWIVERWADPMFQRNFNYVLSESWWSDHVRTLREQEALMQSMGLLP